MLRINRLITGRYARSLKTTAAVTNVSKSITKAQVQAGEREAREQERLQKNGKKWVKKRKWNWKKAKKKVEIVNKSETTGSTVVTL